MADISTTYSELFIVEAQPPFSSRAFQFVPEVIENPRSAKLQEVVIIGRNDALLHYINGQESLRLELEFLATSEKKDDVKKTIDWFKSLTMNDGYSGKIRNVKLIMGNVFTNEVWLVEAVEPKMSHFSQKDAWMPLRATIGLNLKLDPNKNRYIDDVRNGNA